MPPVLRIDEAVLYIQGVRSGLKDHFVRTLCLLVGGLLLLRTCDPGGVARVGSSVAFQTVVRHRLIPGGASGRHCPSSHQYMYVAPSHR